MSRRTVLIRLGSSGHASAVVVDEPTRADLKVAEGPAGITDRNVLLAVNRHAETLRDKRKIIFRQLTDM